MEGKESLTPMVGWVEGEGIYHGGLKEREDPTDIRGRMCWMKGGRGRQVVMVGEVVL